MKGIVVHLVGCQDRLDEDGGTDGPPGDAERILGQVEHLVPEPRLGVALQFRKVEVWTATTLQELSCIVKKIEAEVKQAG